MKRLILFTFASLFSSSLLFGQGCLRITGVDPVNNIITISNTTGAVADISDYRMCSLFSYTSDITNSTTILFGDPGNIPDGGTVAIQWPIDDVAADVAIYLPSGSFSDPAAMVDFMQYGSAGNGREGEAVDAGLWTAGEFVASTSAMVWVGDCDDHSASNWISTDINELSEVSFNLAPNPVQDELLITLNGSVANYINLSVYDMAGKVLVDEQLAVINGMINLSTSDWNSGTYIVRLNFDNGNFALKKVIKE